MAMVPVAPGAPVTAPVAIPCRCGALTGQLLLPDGVVRYVSDDGQVRAKRAARARPPRVMTVATPPPFPLPGRGGFFTSSCASPPPPHPTYTPTLRLTEPWSPSSGSEAEPTHTKSFVAHTQLSALAALCS